MAGWPNSLAEYRFLSKVSSLSKTPGTSMRLQVMMEGEWEIVCDAHGYGGDFYLAQYGQTYPSVGDMQDSAWGIIFIRADGTYAAVSSNCGKTGVVVRLPGCMKRSMAILHASTTGYGKCAEFR